MLAKILRSLSPLALAAAALTLIGPAPLVAQATSSLVANRLTQPIDDNARITLKGTVHPLARAANDRGAASASMPLDRLTLVLKRSDAQESALRQIISDMHTPGSASYHKWLTPDQFGKQFGPSDSDLAAVQAWLQSHGFAVTKINPGRQSIEISGNVAQFRDTFHSQIHKYVVNGETHYANSTDPQIPAALAPVVSGFASLNNFRLKSHARVLGQATYNTQTHTAKPQWTYGSGTSVNFPLAPQDYAVQYNLSPLYSAGTNGTGQSIAIVNDSNINVYLVNQFRSIFNLPANPPQVIIDGNDPGVDGINNPDGPNFDSIEAYLDVEWSGAVAPNATINLVVAADTALQNGLILALQHAIFGNVAPVVSLSFGACESALGSSNAFISALYEQAAAQGQTVLVSSGDSGSAACDSANSQFALRGQQVSGYASTPYNVAVGGTDFFYSDYATGGASVANYWNSAPQQAPAQSIKQVIPEQPWNDSQYGLNIINYYTDITGSTATTIGGGGGGASNCGIVNSSGACTGGYPKPSWQTGAGVPTDSVRDIPDVSLFAADGLNYTYYPVCAVDGDCQTPSGTNLVQITGLGGTSASAPAFAGIMALVNQKYGPQGQANFVLYPLKAQYPAAFHDVTQGTISVPCNFSGSSPNCISVTSPITIGPVTEGQIGTGTTAEYNAGAGYNLATGLGTVDANALVTNWGNIHFTNSSVMLTSPTAGSTFTHGSTVTFTASVAGTSPTGQVALMTDNTEATTQGITNATLSGGSATATTTLLPGGSYHVWAHYGGDGKNSENDSAKASITVSPEASGVFLNVMAPGNGTVPSGTTNIPYGTPLVFSAQVAPSSKLSALEACFNSSSACPVYGIPTGVVTFSDNGTKINTAVLNAEGDAEYNTIDQTVPVSATNVGSHSITASYAGDNSYNASSASATTYTITKADITLAVNWPNQNLYAGQVSTITVIVQTSGAGAPPTGAISVTGAPAGTTTSALSYSGVDVQTGGTDSFATITFPASTAAQTYNLTISYSGDSNYNSFSGTGTITFASKPSQTPTTTVITTTRSSTSPSTLVGITVTVTGSGGTTPPTGTIALITSSGSFQPLTLSPNSGSNNTSSVSIGVDSSGILQGSNLLTAGYSGDSHYAPSTSAAVNLANPLSDFSMVPETTIVSVTAGGSSSTDTINVSSVNGFSGAVSFTCAATTVTCNVTSSATLSAGSSSPLTLTIGGASGIPNGDYDVSVIGKDSTGQFVHTLAIKAVVTAGSTTPTFSLNASPTTLNIAAGATTGNTSVILASSVNSFTGTVNYTCAVTGGPSGATSPPTCSLSPASVDITGSNTPPSLVTVTTTSTTSTGAYTLTVTGTSGSITQTATVTVNVTAAQNFTLSNSGAITLTAGNSGTSTISVTPSGGFTGNVALACSVTPPSGATSPATCSLNPTTAMVSGTSAVTSTLTVNTTSTTTAGSYTVTTTGTLGTLTSSTPLTLTVTAPPTPSYALSNGGGITVTQGSSGTSTISVTPSGGFTGNVALSCTSSNSAAVTCSLNPTTANVTGTSAVTSTLSINASSNSGALDRPLDKLFTIGGGAALALLVFFGIPARRRSWRAILGVVLFGAIIGIGIGCGSSGGGSGSASYTVTVTGTSGSTSQSTTVSITVNK
jgi:hypothetical protein